MDTLIERVKVDCSDAAENLSERERLVLGAVVKDYIDHAEPVGSRTIASRYYPGLSSATIRNIMAGLEKTGFLFQPHTSAGRIPTEKAFRLYLDTLLELEEPGAAEKEFLYRRVEPFFAIKDILTGTTKALSHITNCTGLAFLLGSYDFTIRDIRLLPIDSESLLLVLVPEAGRARTSVFRGGAEAGGLDFEKISNYLTEIGRGLTVKELRGRIVEEMRHEKNLYNELLAKALHLGELGLSGYGDDDGEGSLYVEGQANILEYQEFREDFEKMKQLFTAFEEKSLLVKLLDRGLRQECIQVYLGSESSIEGFDGLSFVIAPYHLDKNISGAVGLIGPVRMDYSKIVPLVSYAAGLIEG
ncbi:MAG: heat-inducible transcriptional repressor HrcA [Thermodesulfobacteriota bacterium]